jgi:DNA polymerase-1
METNKRQAREQGYVETLFGRRVWLPGITSPNGGIRSNSERAAINAPLQGSNADIIKLAMPEVERLAASTCGYSEPSSRSLRDSGASSHEVDKSLVRRSPREGDQAQVRLLMQVHDELVLEAHPEVVDELKSKLPEVMCGVVKLRVPLAVEVGVGLNWDEAH